MIRVSIFAILLGLMSLSACKKEDLKATFDVKRTASVSIPPSSIIELPNIISPTVSTNWEGEFSSNDTRKDQIESVYLKDMQMVITSPPGKTWRFVEQVDIYIQASGLDETLIATRKDIADTVGQYLKMTPIRTDLNPYIQKDNFTVRARVITDEINNDDVDARVDMTFEVTARVLE